MTLTRPHRLSSQRGTSLLGLAFIAIIVGFVMLMGARIFPAVNEYLTIRKVVATIVHSNPATAADVRAAFERSIEIEYSIHSITSKDLQIVQEGDKLKISYAYSVEIPIVEPAFLLLKFEGSGKTGGGL